MQLVDGLDLGDRHRSGFSRLGSQSGSGRGGGGPVLRARAGHHPPRHQAGEHPDRQRRQGPRRGLRHRQGRDRHGRHDPRDGRSASLREPGTSDGRERRSAVRSVFARHRPIRGIDRRQPVRPTVAGRRGAQRLRVKPPWIRTIDPPFPLARIHRDAAVGGTARGAIASAAEVAVELEAFRVRELGGSTSRAAGLAGRDVAATAAFAGLAGTTTLAAPSMFSPVAADGRLTATLPPVVARGPRRPRCCRGRHGSPRRGNGQCHRRSRRWRRSPAGRAALDQTVEPEQSPANAVVTAASPAQSPLKASPAVGRRRRAATPTAKGPRRPLCRTRFHGRADGPAEAAGDAAADAQADPEANAPPDTRSNRAPRGSARRLPGYASSRPTTTTQQQHSGVRGCTTE